MKTEYYVMHKKDLSGPTLKENRAHRDIYDRKRDFQNLPEALQFAMTVLHEQPIVMKYAALAAKGSEQVRYPDKPYVVAAYFDNKYSSYCMGERDSAPTYEIEKCNRESLETTLMKIAEEAPQKLLWGLELKLIPSLDMFTEG